MKKQPLWAREGYASDPKGWRGPRTNKLGPYGPRPRWTRADLALLRKLYPSRSNEEIARETGWSVSAVRSKASLMGLRKTKKHRTRMARENLAIRYGQR